MNRLFVFVFLFVVFIIKPYSVALLQSYVALFAKLALSVLMYCVKLYLKIYFKIYEMYFLYYL